VNPSDQRAYQPRKIIRIDARLDPMTQAKLGDLASSFLRSRAAVLRQLLQWGLRRGPAGKPDQRDAQGPITSFFFSGESEPYEQV
jgi:hypothetical protein